LHALGFAEHDFTLEAESGSLKAESGPATPVMLESSLRLGYVGL
jgi:hypothetical protein